MANCAKCGKEYTEDELFFIDGEFICADCATEAGYAQCQVCGEWFVADDGYEYFGEPLCQSCYEDGYCTCDDCGEVISNDDATEIHGRNGRVVGYVCENCADDYPICIDCDDHCIADYGSYDSDGDFLCDSCHEYNDWVWCESCGRWSRNYNESGGEFLCMDCYRREDRFSTRLSDIGDVDHGEAIHRYGFKPRAVIRKRTNEPETELTIGWELEVDSPDYSLLDRAEPTAMRIKEISDRVYMKHDGSLRTGFEIVSHPGTLGHHMYEMSIRGIMSACLKAGFRSHDAGTCGLHVHVGRAGLGATDEERKRNIRKVIVLMNRYWEEIKRFTRRTDEQINGWAALNHISGYRMDAHIDDAWAESRIRICNSHDDRYVAINCENEATIEFRIFRGTLKRDTLIAALQLCWNICKYAMSHDWDEIQSGTWLDMAQYKHWNELDGYLAARGLAPAAPLPQNTRRSPEFGGPDGI